MDLMENLRENKFFGDIQIIKFEKEVVYRSNFIHTLYRYVELQYGGVDLSQMLSVQTMNSIKKDKAVIGLLALVLHKRMFIIDDMEFVGKKQLQDMPWLHNLMQQCKIQHQFQLVFDNHKIKNNQFICC